jgi:hypothetical protein
MPSFYKFAILSLNSICCPSHRPAAAAAVVPTAAAAVAVVGVTALLLLPLRISRAALPCKQQAA